MTERTGSPVPESGPELLLPAGELSSVTAAVRCGADAVYLGGQSFSARQNARNFSPEELEQAVRFLPGQRRCFCIPYCLFIFSCNMAADVLFLLSWQIQNGGVTALTIAGAVFFALQSAVLSVLLEWFYPIRGWKIESDLWHHPRKYVVPVVMLLLAGGACVWPVMLYVLLALLAVEIAILLFICRRHPE